MPSEETSLLPQVAGPSLAQKSKAVLRLVISSSPVNWLLLFVPLGILANWLHWGSTAVFVFNFLGIVPLASVLAYATEELGDSIHNNSIAGLLNATFGNAVEVIVSVIALTQNQITVVQASMLGSILSNLLLVLGSCFVTGGIFYKEQSFNQTVAQTMSSLMALSVAGLLLPAAFYTSLPKKTPDLETKILSFSRGTAILLLIVYCLYMVFQLKTHKHLFEDAEEDVLSEVQAAIEEGSSSRPDILDPRAAPESSSVHTAHSRRSSVVTKPKSLYPGGELKNLSALQAVGVLAVTTLLVSICADYLVSSIDDIVESSGLSKTFIGLVVIPIVGNAAEHVTAIVVAYKNKMDLAIGVAVGSSIQIALFVTPFLVLIGWIINIPMSLFFSTYETAVMFVSVFITNYLILDGESNWLEGAMLIATYVIIAISFYYYPDTIEV